MKKVDITKELRVHIARTYDNQAQAAAAWKMSRSYLSEILCGHKPPTEVMLKDCGFRRVAQPAQVRYVKV